MFKQQFPDYMDAELNYSHNLLQYDCSSRNTTVHITYN